jgi:hypothetical protein
LPGLRFHTELISKPGHWGRGEVALFILPQQATGHKTEVKFAEPRPYAAPEAAMHKLLEIANSVEAVQDGRIHIEKINGPFLFEHGGKPAEYGAGLKLAIERGLLWKHEGADLFS